MSDYMPTTENVRRAWAWWRKPMMGNKDYYPDEESLFEVTDLELDRWLDEVKAEAWHEGYGRGRDDQEAETRTDQMHAALNPYREGRDA